MEPFELFVREQAQNYPIQTLQTTLNKWNKKQNKAPDFDNDPVAWALAVDGVVEELMRGQLISALKLIRNASGYMGLKEAKDLMELCRNRLGLTVRQYGRS